VTQARPGPSGPEAMRQAMAAYVRAVHQAYLDTVAQAVAIEEARTLPLAKGPFTVAAVGAGQLHVIATRDLTLQPDEREVAIEEELGLLRWTVRFLDPVVLPKLGMIDDTGPWGGAVVVETLGLGSVLYQLTAALEGSLSPHQAIHAGVGLANAHLTGRSEAVDGA
jgi:hypothetical protein